MIIRMFRGVVRPGAAEEFERFLRDEATPMFEAHPAVRAVHVAPPPPGRRDFAVITVWDDLASIRSFVGDDWRSPLVSPLERELLSEKEVSHFEDLAGSWDRGWIGRRLEALEGAVFGARDGQVRAAGRLSLDPARRVARVDGHALELPPQEFAVLSALAARTGEPVSAAELAGRVWPGSGLVTADDVRRAVYRVRKVLRDQHRRPPLIRNRRGYGYVLEP